MQRTLDPGEMDLGKHVPSSIRKTRRDLAVGRIRKLRSSISCDFSHGIMIKKDSSLGVLSEP